VRIGRHEDEIEDALARLMDEYERPLLAFVRSLLRDADLALDCVQETFLRAYEALSRGRQINGGWLYTVARSRAMDELRRRGRMRMQPRDVNEVRFDPPDDTGLAVWQVMDGMRQQDREVLYLFAIAGFKTDEIAGLLGTTGTAVRQRLYRARREFRRMYGERPRG
jgi:RNA polymerase sigma-70 factor (ECF subfamily)